MAKRKKRNAITLVSLLLALAALIGVYYWYSNYKTTKEAGEEEATPTIDLATVDTTQLSSLHVIMKDADINLVLDGEVWKSLEEPDRPMNQDYVKAMLNAINDINADRVIMEKPENLADYGLVEPAATVVATMSDGTAVTIKIGNKVSNSKGYYGLVNEDGTVYLLPIEMGTAFQYTDVQMTSVAESPEITAENIHYLLVDSRDGQDYELQYNGSGELDNSGNGLNSWEILKPYGKGYTAESSKVSEIQAYFTSFDYKSCVDYKGDNLSLYGLDNPADIIDIGYYVTRTEALETPETDPETGEEITEKTYYDPYEYKISVGNLDEEGNYYVKIDGSPSVYTIGADTINKMLTVDAFSMLNPYVLIPNIANVDQIVFDVMGTEYKMGIDYTATTNADGKAETVGTYSYQGNKVDEDAFKKLYQSLISATYDAEIKEAVDTEGVKPYMTMTFHIFGDNERTLTASFLPYNDSFYIVKKDDETRFFVDKRKVDEIVSALSSFTGTITE